MIKETVQLKSSHAGVDLNVILWCPDGDVKGIVLYAHGMIDQMRRHWKFGEFLAENGFVFIGNDHLGHGQTSTEERGYFADKEGDRHLVRDQKIVADYAMERFPGAPLFVMGQSMGSFIARNFIAEYDIPIKGAIFASTGYIPPFKINFALFVTNLSCLFLGKHHVAKRINYMSCLSNDKKFTDSKYVMRWLTKDYTELKRLFKTYPNEFFTFKAGGFRDMFRLIRKCQSKKTVSKIDTNIQILLISGSQDALGDMGKGVERTAEIYRRHGNQCDVIIYDDIRHDLEAECHEKYHQDVLDWISSKL